jgi:hypothetical protein
MLIQAPDTQSKQNFSMDQLLKTDQNKTALSRCKHAYYPVDFRQAD